MKNTDRHRSVAKIRGFVASNRRTATTHTFCEARPPSGGGPCGLRNSATGRWRSASIVATILLAATASAANMVDLRVYPAEVKLETAQDRQSIVVQAVFDDTTTRDVTGEATFAVADGTKLKVENAAALPLADGTTEIAVAWGGREVKLPANVREAAASRPVRFTPDVMPVFMKYGCNTGPCHGSARGQDGFRLSLFGYDPAGDHHRITREFSGRRINLAHPEESLLVTKALGAVQHTGGELFKADSPPHQTLLAWLRDGAKADPADAPRVTAVSVRPDRIVLSGSNATQRLVVRAEYSDGTDRDVTPMAVFKTTNETSAPVEANGVVRSAMRGEAFVMARYDAFTVGAQVIVVPDDPAFRFPDSPAANYIDELVLNKLRRLRVPPSDICSDEDFLRRVHIDITGTLPDGSAHTRFMNDPAPDKRARLVDELLNRKEFVEMWVMKWSELLQIRSNNEFSYKQALLYHQWLRDRISRNVPINTIVTELLTASGGTLANPAANYWQVETDTLKLAENAAQVFTGIRMQCAQCHNHPFDRWSMDDYYGFNAFFQRIGRKKGEDPRETIVFTKGDGEAKHPVDGRVVPPRFLGGGEPDAKKSQDRRVALAEWLTAPDNPYFAPNLANITWAHFMGQGITEPVDDVRISNPPSNPELLDALAKRLVESGYDFKALVRDICASHTYQRSTRPKPGNESDTRNFAKADVRRIRAEVLLDVISAVTNTKDKFKGLPLGARAVQIADGTTTAYFLTAFGRATRGTVCSCEVKMEPNLSQALHLLNGDTTHKKVREGGVVRRLLEQQVAPPAILDDIFLRCLARLPTDAEKAALLPEVEAAADKAAILEDIFWAVLNSKEFMFNH